MLFYPPLQPVDDDVVGIVGDVERHQTQVCEVPEELKRSSVKFNLTMDKSVFYF